MNVYIKQNSSYSNPVLYVLKVLEKNRNLTFTFVDSAENAQLVWDENHSKSQVIASDFYRLLKEDDPELQFDVILDDSMCITNGTGQKDLIATIFYVINCLQESNPKASDLDQFGRFKFEASLQHKFGVIEQNLVEQFLDSFCEINKIDGTKSKSTFFISHDIDTIYGSLFQDGFWALKKLKVGALFQLLAYEIGRNPHWKNMDRIIKINDEYDVKSTFFWLVNKGIGTQDVKNADYKIEKEKRLQQLVYSSGNTNGLHKSCSEMSIDQEIEKGGLDGKYNRYHFLNFRTDKDWAEISSSKLEFDCSLGFAEHYGFRNSYGKAFQPYDLKNETVYNFVEAPLHFMDTTFHKYMKMPTDRIGDTIIDFYTKNPVNCDFSLLWHNTYFTNYKYNGFLKEYKKVLSFMFESKIECLTPADLVEQNKLTW